MCSIIEKACVVIQNDSLLLQDKVEFEYIHKKFALSFVTEKSPGHVLKPLKDFHELVTQFTLSNPKTHKPD